MPSLRSGAHSAIALALLGMFLGPAAIPAALDEPAGSGEASVQRTRAGSRASVSINLREAVGRALARNPTRVVLIARLEESKALTRQAESFWAGDPSFALRHQNDAIGDQDGLREWEWGVELPLWLPGQKGARQAVAQEAAAAASASGSALALAVAGLVREALWDVALRENQAAIASRERDTAAQLEGDVGKRVRLGDLARADLILAQQETLARRAAELRARGEHANARHRYAALTGLEILPDTYREQPARARTVGDHHPLLAERNQVRGERYASPTLTVGTRHEREASEADYANGFGAILTVPLGLASQRAPALARAELSLAEAQGSREALRRRLALAAEEAARDLETVRAELAVAERQHALAQENLGLARRSFALGESDLVSLMRIQALAFGAERGFRQKGLELGLAIARLNQAMGVVP